MRDYAELILDLRRHHCDAKEDDTQEVCEECAYDVIVADKSKFNGITDVCTCGLMHRAAGAIEELLGQHEADAKEIAWLKKCVQDLPKPQKWISVKKQLPKDGEFVLVCNDDGHMMIAKHESEVLEWYYKYTNYDFDIWENEEQGPICYWMPLPTPPKGVE